MSGDVASWIRVAALAGIVTVCTASTVAAGPVHAGERHDSSSSAVDGDDLLDRIQQLVDRLVRDRFRELEGKDVRVKSFASRADYFRTSLSVWRFLVGARMRYFVLVNPAGVNRGWPPEGVEAIAAHELAHVVRMAHGPRLHLLSYVRLLFAPSAARFERRADLDAVERGFGCGLQTYRAWLYRNVPPTALAEKQRNYFAPDEIEALMQEGGADPSLFAYWREHVPMDLGEIRKGR